MNIDNYFIKQIKKFINANDKSNVEYQDDISNEDFTQLQKDKWLEFLLLDLRCEINRRIHFIRNIFLLQKDNIELAEKVNKEYLKAVRDGEFPEYEFYTLIKKYFQFLNLYNLQKK